MFPILYIIKAFVAIMVKEFMFIHTSFCHLYHTLAKMRLIRYYDKSQKLAYFLMLLRFHTMHDS